MHITSMLLAAASVLGLSTAASAQTIPWSVIDTAGNVVCNEAGSFEQVPGLPDYFIGRVLATGTQSFCNIGKFTTRPTLGIFQMQWAQSTLVLQYTLVTLPKVINGQSILSLYDPSVMTYNGTTWVAAECVANTAGGIQHVSSCVVPLVNMQGGPQLDLTRFSVPILGNTVNGVAIDSASVPRLVNWFGTPYIYWTDDSSDTTKPHISRGAQLVLDSNGRLYATGSGGAPISTTDPNLTTIVRDVNLNDPTRNFQAAVRFHYPDPSGNGFYVFSSIGGTGCTAPNQPSPGCGRLEVTYSTNPLGYDVFASNVFPTNEIPVNPMDYPKPLTDDLGQRWLSANFFRLSTTWNVGYAPATGAVNTGLIPFPNNLP